MRLNSSRDKEVKSWESYLAWGKIWKLDLEELEFGSYDKLWEGNVGFGSVIICGDEVKICLFWWGLKLISSLFWWELESWWLFLYRLAEENDIGGSYF